MKDRIIYYIDGLNLYRGLKDAGLRKYCYFYGKIFISNIRKSQLPEIIINQDGFKIEKPKYWN